MSRRSMLNQVTTLSTTSEKEYGAKQRKPNDTVANLNEIVEEEGENGEKLKDEHSICQRFLVDTEDGNWETYGI